MIAWDRAPFWTVSTPAMQSFASRFNSAYGSYPNEFAIIGYTAVQGWEYAVRQAKSFATDQVVAALAGATVPTIRGDITVRACDHQAEVPEDTGTIAATPSAQYGVPLWTNVFTAQPAQILSPCPSRGCPAPVTASSRRERQMTLDSGIITLLSAMTEASSLFIAAAGLTLVFGAMRIINIAHGSFYMYGAFFVTVIVGAAGAGSRFCRTRRWCTAAG